MLSRVADSLYWMSRSVERAENIARILDVNIQLMLDLPKLDAEEQAALWLPVLRSTGDGDFQKHYKEPKSESVIEHLTLNPKNPNSILNCLTNARENARHAREQISLEMWEEINRAYLSLGSMTAKKIAKQGAYDFYNHIKNASALFQGITDGTMTHGEDWDFIQVGSFLERADMTTRILDAHDEIFINTPATQAQTGGTLQWSAILRSCSSHDAYRKFYVAQVEPDKVVEFLILNESFPRSIRFCVQAMDDALRRISGSRGEAFSNQAEKLAGRLVADLNFSALEDIKTVGMHNYMDELQVKLNAIGEAIYKTYLFCPPRDTPEAVPASPPVEAKPAAAPARTKTSALPKSGMTQEQGGMSQGQTLGDMKQSQG
jgi:uncharacterized alpha-E superfamily protein